MPFETIDNPCYRCCCCCLCNRFVICFPEGIICEGEEHEVPPLPVCPDTSIGFTGGPSPASCQFMCLYKTHVVISEPGPTEYPCECVFRSCDIPEHVPGEEGFDFEEACANAECLPFDCPDAPSDLPCSVPIQPNQHPYYGMTVGSCYDGHPEYGCNWYWFVGTLQACAGFITPNHGTGSLPCVRFYLNVITFGPSPATVIMEDGFHDVTDYEEWIANGALGTGNGGTAHILPFWDQCSNDSITHTTNVTVRPDNGIEVIVCCDDTITCVPPPEEPGLMRKVVNFVPEFVKHVRHGLPLVSDDEKQARLDICGKCEWFNKTKVSCRKCGCGLQRKASWSLSKCPIGKW